MAKPDQDPHPNKPLAQAPWLRAPALGKLLEVLTNDGGDARVVGGSVRNALLGEPITDIDVATPLLPEAVMKRASLAGLGMHPTGLEHGTVTIVSDGQPFEVTTLRRDVETDGRRAVVAFSTDWCEDAARRDFTINALYVGADGEVFDYFGGREDLAARRVRFIGDPHQRIREDYLRILRFFRFTAQISRDAPDADGLAACVALKDGLARLSLERIGVETIKLIAAPRAAEVVEVMAQCSILKHVLGRETHPERLTRMVAIEAACGLPPDDIARLAALTLDNPSGASHLAAHLRLSNAQADALAGAARHHPSYAPETPEPEARRWLYQTGADNFLRGALVAWAAGDDPASDVARKERAFLPHRWPIPALPVRGADVLALGVAPGPKVGEIIEAFEHWWMSADFPADPAEHRSMLQALAANRY
ncbi:MAG: CCA tRNA nucleotidyltransferase [Hyphomicrobium sp.]